MSIKKFKEETSFENRIQNAKRLMDKYPDRIPIICGLCDKAILEFPEYNKMKYLVPKGLTMGQFLHVIRKNIKLNSSEALYIFTENNTLCSLLPEVERVYNEFKSNDGFLYLIVAKESTFGKKMITF